MTIPAPQRDFAGNILGLLFIGLLIAGSLLVFQPFVYALIWGTMIVIATWPIMLRVQTLLWGRRSLAVTVMVAALLLLLVVPFSLAINTIVDNADRIVGWGKSLANFTIPPPPEWVQRLPLVGSKLAVSWEQLAAARPDEMTARLTPYIGKIIGWFVNQAGSFGMIFLHFLLALVIAGILFANGETAAEAVRRFAHRLAGSHGENSARLAASAVRAVALGIIVTALVQSILAGIGLAVAGLQYATLLTALIFMLGVLQVGPAPVLLPTIVWFYWKGDLGWGTAMLVWSIIVGSLDNLMRPLLIKKGANLPLLLIFSGVLGGLVAFGIIGLFVGPVVLAVSYTLLVAWVRGEDLDLPPDGSAGSQDGKASPQISGTEPPEAGAPMEQKT